MKAEEARVGRVALQYGSELTREVNRKQLIDIQAVAVSVYQYYYWAEPEIGARAARLVNDELAEATSKYPDRFVALGSVPLQDTAAAVAELRYCVNELGFRGLEINSHVNGSEIADPRLDPFWAEVEKLGAVIVVHTNGHPAKERLQEHNFVNVLGHAFEATLATANLIFNGVMERYPNLKIVVVHGGGYLPAYAGRMDHAWRARADVREGVPRPPGEYLKKFYFDTMVFEPDQVEFLINKYGADHVLLGTDYPYDMGEDDPLGLIGSVPGLSQDQIDLISGGNAARLLGFTD